MSKSLVLMIGLAMLATLSFFCQSCSAQNRLTSTYMALEEEKLLYQKSLAILKAQPETAVIAKDKGFKYYNNAKKQYNDWLNRLIHLADPTKSSDGLSPYLLEDVGQSASIFINYVRKVCKFELPGVPYHDAIDLQTQFQMKLSAVTSNIEEAASGTTFDARSVTNRLSKLGLPSATYIAASPNPRKARAALEIKTADTAARALQAKGNFNAAESTYTYAAQINKQTQNSAELKDTLTQLVKLYNTTNRTVKAESVQNIIDSM
jgi:hypothetical protein